MLRFSGWRLKGFGPDSSLNLVLTFGLCRSYIFEPTARHKAQVPLVFVVLFQTRLVECGDCDFKKGLVKNFFHMTFITSMTCPKFQVNIFSKLAEQELALKRPTTASFVGRNGSFAVWNGQFHAHAMQHQRPRCWSLSDCLIFRTCWMVEHI